MKNLKSRLLKLRSKHQKATNQTDTPSQLFTQEYLDSFLQPRNEVARHGKTIYINKEHHTRVQRIIYVVGDGKVTLTEYVNNVLTDHFATFKDEIMDLYDKHDKNPF